MYMCPVCNNDTFIYKELTDGRLAICTVCREECWDDEDDYDEYEEDYE